MSIKTYDDSLDYLPAAKKRGPGLWNGWSLFIEALAEAKAAEADYRRFVARGMQPSKAASLAFQRNFKS